ncbi:bifunctional hydroxymethylpyrimidine kinase/phosphomethylpyrimidine kinase [Eubacteriaceae bacterium ES3]|nr:bifunctional hydroxymethylpyrimidine kinase/phosphomethylpyrimidine kinase [Eubacteriaceae bacterium ES3]
MKKILTIAGSDSSGGAGIQADIKTITVHQMYAMSAITAITAQNTMGVYGVMEVSPECVGKQIDCIFKDIRPDAVKIGMVSSNEIIEVIAQKLKEYEAENIVVDPVMISTSGSKLLSDDAMEALITNLLPLGTVITPNISEAEVLSEIEIKDETDMLKAVKIISRSLNGAILVKGGHLGEDATDLLYKDGELNRFKSRRIETANTHGTGCTLSSAIACNLASGMGLSESVRKAKEFLTGALEADLDLGKGSGPLNHMYRLL